MYERDSLEIVDTLTNNFFGQYADLLEGKGSTEQFKIKRHMRPFKHKRNEEEVYSSGFAVHTWICEILLRVTLKEICPKDAVL